MVAKRFKSYAKACLKSHNLTQQTAMRNAKMDKRSVFGKNFEEYHAGIHTKKYSDSEMNIADKVGDLLFDHELREFIGTANVPVLVMLLTTN